MIFIALGNNKQSFVRLLNKFKKIYDKMSEPKAKVICQIGYTNYSNKKFKIIKFVEKKKFIELVKKSNLFISHAGAGCIIDSINNKKVPILLPREKKYNEHADNHQIDLYKKLIKNKHASSFKQIYMLKNKKIQKANFKKKIFF
jgi:UDP-N-acetylglucosamine transferase subunit ALG13